MTKYGMSILHLGDPLWSTWINQKTGELVTVDGRECPEGWIALETGKMHSLRVTLIG
jgi:hypothetical protein